ncbi:DUF4186 domain-containing protein [Bifidobacterium oedipodis]|uniref:DUF4186 domain-containing protein n=1 Tax=Bifidobacterium oedipodis TaxID=2675322 RepID=UPI003AA93665
MNNTNTADDADDTDAERERQWIEKTLERLSHSPFRAKFVLSSKDRAYARAKGEVVIASHARDMLRSRVGQAQPEHDGRQTPWKGHPVFTAQHATATCCRGCIAKWHHIPEGRELSDDEINRLADLIMAWITRDLTAHPSLRPGTQTNGSTDSQPNKRTNDQRNPQPGNQPTLF